MADDAEESGGAPASLPSDADMEAALRMLKAAMDDEELWKSKACRKLRAAVAPLGERLRAAMFGGATEGDFKLAAKRKRADDTVKNFLKLEDRKTLEKTRLRAGRIAKLNDLTAADGHTARVLDGVGDDDGMGGRLLKDGDAGAGEGEGAPPAVEGEAEGAGAGADTGESTLAGGVRRLHFPRACYACKRRFTELHHFYDTLCPTCSALNWTKRHQSANLSGRVALVTGARVKIGFHVCLKLLRAGASVIATTRFPVDAAARFAALPDYPAWGSRLAVYGLDLRDIPGVEALTAVLARDYPRLDMLINNACQTVRRPPEYYAHMMPGEAGGAAAASPAARPLLLRNEEFQRARAAAAWGPEDVLLLGGGGAPARPLITDAMEEEGGARGAAAVPVAPAPVTGGGVGALTSAQLSQLALVPSDAMPDPSAFPAAARDVNAQQLDLRTSNSWTARLGDVSTPECAEVMAINAISPFVLCAKLKPMLMRGNEDARPGAGVGAEAEGGGAPSLAETILREGCGGDGSSGGRVRGRDVGGAAKRPRRDAALDGGIDGGVRAGGETASHRVPAHRARFIVNVSSMEGKFYRSKEAAHPHTNMAKAALNMLTRTSARDYAESFIYMTAVDTGWINDENPAPTATVTAARHNFATPLDEIDAAARILDPILAPLAEAEAEAAGASGGGGGTCAPVYGAFLKDYFSTEW